MKFADVKLSALKPNDYNPNVMPDEIFKQLQANIAREGFQRQIIVREDLVIVDGEHRYKALKNLNKDDIDVPVIILDYSEAEKFLERADTIKLNQIHGEPDEVLLAMIIRDLIKDIGIDEASNRLGYTQPELQSMNDLIDYTPNKFIVTATERMAVQKSDEMLQTREFSIELNAEEAKEYYQAKAIIEKAAGKSLSTADVVTGFAKAYIASFK